MTSKTDNDNYQDNYKNTLNLPHTDFPMKANLAEREPKILEKWQAIGLYEAIQHQNQNKEKFIFHNGPPYANGNIHLGHAVNYVLKDIVVKFKTLSGYRAPFVPGWDCHGLPIELNVEKKEGKAGVKIDAKTFRQKCREYASKQIDLQREAFIRLGVLADWKNPYLTMDFGYEAEIVRSLARILENGYVHKGYKPVHWCIDCGSALAEAEVEYQDKTSPAIDVCFEVLDNDSLPFEKNPKWLEPPVYFVIWTTTPWTLPANEAVAVHPDHTYVLLKVRTKEGEEKTIILLSELMDSVLKRYQIDINEIEILGKTVGKTLEGIALEHPFYDKQVPVILSDHVTLDAGTGAVHTAPAHGQEDFLLGEKYQLPLENPVGGNGCYVMGTPLFAGMPVMKANDEIIKLLKEKNCLLHSEKIQHSYPHCWRHKTPLIFRATQQWFIGMAQKNLREKILKTIPKVKWIPSWGQSRMEGMFVEDRPDWCISRQRTWGVPLCFFQHKDTGNLHPKNAELMEVMAKKIEQFGIEAWFDTSKEALWQAADLDVAEASNYEKSMDSLDVWFDSGVSHACVLEQRSDLAFPADLYLEGSDQHRGWFQSSLITSVAMHGEAPYRQVLTHGFTVDAQGRKMSKSLGNVVAPEKVISTLGADVLRLWISATDYRREIVVSDEILRRTSDTYRRIRNTARFLLSNLNAFDPNRDAVPADQLLALDSWIIDRAKQVQSEIIQAFEDYQFHVVYQKMHHFCSQDLGSFYLDIIKDRQYTGKKQGIPRRSAQTAMFHIAEALVRWMAPILSFTAEEIWQYMPGERHPSVFLSEWYQAFPEPKEKETMTDSFWQQVLKVKEAVNKALEDARNNERIGSGLEAELELYCDPFLLNLLGQLQEELRFVLITSEAHIFPESQRPKDAEAATIPGLWLKVNASSKEKCVRCWHYREDVSANENFPGLCSRCIENVEGVGESRQYA